MSQDNEGMLDKLGDLVHHSYEYIHGVLAPPSAPNKPAATSTGIDPVSAARRQQAGGSANVAENAALQDT